MYLGSEVNNVVEVEPHKWNQWKVADPQSGSKNTEWIKNTVIFYVFKNLMIKNTLVKVDI